jgi:hypothetical protein
MQSPGFQPGVLQVSTGGGHYIGGPIQTTGGAVILGNQVAGDYIAGDKVHGNKIYVDKRIQYTVEVYAVPPATPGERRQQILQAGLSPFLPDRPFTVLEEALFAGREDKKQDLLVQLEDAEKYATLVHGAADVGKTSLLTAGVIPELERRGKLVIYQNDFSYPLAGLRGALVGCGARYGLGLSPETSAAQLVRHVVEASDFDLVLILDQFERYYLPGADADERDAFRQELAQAVQNVQARRFHLIIAVRDDLLSSLDREWAELLPGLRYASISLDPLDYDQALEAIIKPVQAINGPGLDKNFTAQLLTDLDSLDKKTDHSIAPADLQIVCYQLYQAARTSDYRTIDQSVYYRVSHNKGAEQIIDRHFDELAARLPEASRAIASEIAFNMVVDPELRFWFRPQDLTVDGAGSQQVENVLKEMTRAGLLIWHQAEGQLGYAFASHSIRGAADRAMGRSARQRRQAGNELELVWRAWMAHDELPGPGVLSFIREHASGQPLPAERVLMLLRSAVKHNAALAPWLEQARREDVRRLIQEIEQPPSASNADSIPADLTERQTRRQQARHILGLTDERLPDCPAAEEFGPLAWAAAKTQDPVCQETDVLALLGAYGYEASNRLRLAAESGSPVRGASQRSIELHGMLADADPQSAAALKKMAGLERLRVWAWRARRRIRHDGRYIRTVAWGGALGAGLALALLRGMLAALLQEQPGFYFYNYFPIGFFLGGGAALGLALTNALLLRPPEHEYTPGSSRPVLWALSLGALCFTMGHFLLSVTLRGGLVFEAPLITLMTLLAGLGIAQAARDLPTYRPGVLGTALRLLSAALIFALVLSVFTAVGKYGVGQTYFWSAEFYRFRLDDVLPLWGLAWVMDLENWDVVISQVDAALVGAVLAAGLMAGMRLAYHEFERWKSLMKRAGG